MPAILPLLLVATGAGLVLFGATKKSKAKTPEQARLDQNADAVKDAVPSDLKTDFNAAIEEAKKPNPDLGKILDTAKKAEEQGAPKEVVEVLQAAGTVSAPAVSRPTTAVKSPGWPQPQPAVTNSNIQEKVAAAVAAGPLAMRELAKVLASLGFIQQAADLYNEANRLEAEIAASKAIPAPAPVPVPQVVLQPTPVEPPRTLAHAAAEKLSAHLNLLNKTRGSVARAKGSEDKSIVKDFQTKAGLKVDGMYGPGTAKAVGHYYGDVPIVYYWPRGTLPATEVPKYRKELLGIADAARTTNELKRAQMLELSAAREKGQGYGTALVSVKPTEDARIRQAEATLSNYLALSKGTAPTDIETIMSKYSS